MRSLYWALALAVTVCVTACGDDDGGGGGGGMPPEITMVTWTHGAGCTPGTSTAVTIVTTATDPDTEANLLTFSGSASGCTGSISSANASLMCPQLSPYPTSVRVTDPEGNMDSLQFTMSPCQNGSAP